MPSWAFTWIDASGNDFALQNPPAYTIIYQSLVGAYAPTFTPVVEYLPLTPGAYLKYVNTDVRTVDLILQVQALTPQILWNSMVGLPYIFSPLRTGISPGNGAPPYPYLQITTPNNTTRNLSCICISDFNLNPSSYYEQSVQVPLQFYASSYPYFFDTKAQRFAYNPTTQNIVQWFPFFPLRLGGPVGTRSNFNIPQLPNYPVGDVPVYPLWKLSGPASGIQLTNNTTGLTFTIPTITPSLPAGAAIWIDMNARTVIRNPNSENPVNILSQVDISSAFWPLDPAGNNITVGVTGGNANTQLSLNWFPGWMGVI